MVMQAFLAYFKLCIKLGTYFVCIIDNKQDSSGIVPRETHWHKFLLFLRAYAVVYNTLSPTQLQEIIASHTEFRTLKRL